jgi:hypothetical protein
VRDRLTVRSRRSGAARLAAVSVLALGPLAGCASTPAAHSAGAATTTSSSPMPRRSHRPSPDCPLTGQPAASAAAARRPALAVKIDNIGPARPQAGLQGADIVVQEQVEGGLTRLFAVFQCHGASNVGPIRSARTTDADLLALLHHSVFGFSGANSRVLPPINAVGHTVQISWDQTPGEFHLDTSRPAPHDVFGSTTTLLAAGRQRHGGPIPPPAPWFSYGPADPHGRRTHTATMSWPAATAAWTWSGKRWLRTQDGTPDVVTGGQRVSAANVVVMGVQLRDTGIRDVAGNPSPDDVVVGSGPVWVLRNGRIVRGTWKRHKVTDPWTFRDAHGGRIRLAPGRTWVELLGDPGTLATH